MGDTPLGKLIVELGIKDTQFSKGVKGAEAELKALRSDLKTSQVAFKSFGGEMDGLGSPMAKLNTLISKQKAYIGELAQQYKGSLNKETGKRHVLRIDMLKTYQRLKVSSLVIMQNKRI
ncbi:hypothetical protein AAFF39_00075 [Lactococcus garvieae]